jgi:hypothetical protein
MFVEGTIVGEAYECDLVVVRKCAWSSKESRHLTVAMDNRGCHGDRDQCELKRH